MDERKREQDDTQIKRETDVRGSLGVPPSGSIEEESRTRAAIAETAERAHIDARPDRGGRMGDDHAKSQTRVRAALPQHILIKRPPQIDAEQAWKQRKRLRPAGEGLLPAEHHTAQAVQHDEGQNQEPAHEAGHALQRSFHAYTGISEGANRVRSPAKMCLA